MDESWTGQVNVLLRVKMIISELFSTFLDALHTVPYDGTVYEVYHVWYGIPYQFLLGKSLTEHDALIGTLRRRK